jgi:hypothetical protein
MRTIHRAFAVVLTLAAAACGDHTQPAAAPAGPLKSEWTRTYLVSGRTYQGTKPFNMVPATFVGGYIKVEAVPDNPAMGAYELGIVYADWDPGSSFFKPANHSLRLTAIPTQANCTFRGWLFPTSSSIATTSNPVNMDNYRPQSEVRGDFLCS